MTTFRQIFEMPTMLKIVKGKSRQPQEPKNGEPVSTTAGGHTIHRFVTPSGVTTRFSAVKDGVRHVHVAGEMSGNELEIHDLSAYEGSTLPAHELYHHLVTHHGLDLVSDSGQSEGGMKVWNRLSKSPGIKVTHRMEDGSEHEPHHDWISNYFRSGSTARGEDNLRGSRFVARKA